MIILKNNDKIVCEHHFYCEYECKYKYPIVLKHEILKLELLIFPNNVKLYYIMKYYCKNPLYNKNYYSNLITKYGRK